MNEPISMPRMPWYPSSFAASTRTWPFIARAVYRELLDIEWDAGGLPSAPHELRSMLNVSAAEWRKAWPLVAPKFELCEDGLLRNRRLEQHRAEAVRLHEQRHRSAKAAAAARWRA